jgi:hypothetical protein
MFATDSVRTLQVIEVCCQLDSNSKGHRTQKQNEDPTLSSSTLIPYLQAMKAVLESWPSGKCAPHFSAQEFGSGFFDS